MAGSGRAAACGQPPVLAIGCRAALKTKRASTVGGILEEGVRVGTRGPPKSSKVP
jgi:hypothetical protein